MSTPFPQPNSTNITTNRAFVTRVEIKQLFGQFNYDLHPQIDYADASRLLILYGENGSGKTTILWLIYHLLAKTGKGHKTYLARTRFLRFAVSLASGVLVSAERNNSLSGSFSMTIQSSKESQQFSIRAEEPNVTVTMDRTPTEERE